MIFVKNLGQWLNSPLGSEVLIRERSFFDQEVVDVFGYNAVQLGLGGFDFMGKNRIPNHLVIGAEGGVDVCCNFGYLPIQNETIDLVVMPHVLEFSGDPKLVLKETTRVLRPEGHLLMSVFNPWSLWGLQNALKKRTGDTQAPWNGEFIALAKLRDWLKLLDYHVVVGKMELYIPPVNKVALRRRFAFLEKAGPRWWPFMGGLYFLYAIKRVAGVTLISGDWPKKRDGAKRPSVLVSPSIRLDGLNH